MFFQYLRTEPWLPSFIWVSTREEAADVINRPHEDYPKRVFHTAQSIDDFAYASAFDISKYEISSVFTNAVIKAIHYGIFFDLFHAGSFRNLDVTVGRHCPPKFIQVEKLMDELQFRYDGLVKNLGILIEWYKDFETIHPFQDGNGRVGGTIVAVVSHQFHPEKGFLVPCQ